MTPEQIEAEYRRLLELDGKRTQAEWSLETVPTSIGSCHKIGPFPSSGARSETFACVYADGFSYPRDEACTVASELKANAQFIASAPAMMRLLTAMRAEMGRLREDAERYRYMRDRNNPLERVNQATHVDNGVSCYHVVGEVRELKHGEELDAAIDTASRGAP